MGQGCSQMCGLEINVLRAPHQQVLLEPSLRLVGAGGGVGGWQ